MQVRNSTATVTTNDKETVQKESHIENYIKSLAAIEESMEPFKEQKRALRDNYASNNWLTKEDQRVAVRAYRLLKGDVDIDQLLDFYEKVQDTFKR